MNYCPGTSPAASRRSIKRVDQTDEAILREGWKEYVRHEVHPGSYLQILEEYGPAAQPAQRVLGGSGCPGFFRVGEVQLRQEPRARPGERPGCRARTPRELLRRSPERQHPHSPLQQDRRSTFPTDAVSFDVSTLPGRHGEPDAPPTSCTGASWSTWAYSRDLDIAELEIGLEEEWPAGRLPRGPRPDLPGEGLDIEKNRPASPWGRLAGSCTSWIRTPILPWIPGSRGAGLRTDISQALLAGAARRSWSAGVDGPDAGLRLVGLRWVSFVARDVQKMLDLQGVIQSLGPGRAWARSGLSGHLAEKLTETGGGS